MKGRIPEPVYYGDYLKLNELLATQSPKSAEYGKEEHEETLFIIVHQVYELWFKQIIHDFGSVVNVFNKNAIEESELGTVVSRLERIIKIQGLLLEQLDVMETMTPMDFLEFRDLLVPASGFQSAQFREIEIRMGLGTGNRIAVDREYFLGRLNDQDRERLTKIEKEPSLLELLEKWLERVPFTQEGNFDFWKEFESVVSEMLDQEQSIIERNKATLAPEMMNAQLANLESTRETFQSLLSSDTHEKLMKEGQRKLSQKATLNALFILLYRDEPILTQPYKFLQLLMDIDQGFTTWRYRHALMAHRMLGTKIGTGGSSGHLYLKRAADNNRVYTDIFNLSTFLIPRSKLPTLPVDVKKKLNFYFFFFFN
ncbi:MAG: tryptophan 2,3-dioxygenase [Deltaproteobacteria bacterium]|nr:MAG: tryptophan 2,3-dioxygenase [Deltaproteobacteria bacterium]